MKEIGIPTKFEPIDVKAATTQALVDFTNKYGGRTNPLKKFKDRATAEKTVTDLMTALTEINTGTSKPSAAKKAAKNAAKATGEKGTSKRTKFANAEHRLYKLVKKNPRREGTNGYKSFELVRNGMTYRQYVEAGGRNNDLRWDVDKGYIVLSPEAISADDLAKRMKVEEPKAETSK